MTSFFAQIIDICSLINRCDVAGNYKGKVISEKDYKKLEDSEKETGYAWKTVNCNGDAIYLDGASHRNSNWLRFVNCARGRCEENVLVRNIPGYYLLFIMWYLAIFVRRVNCSVVVLEKLQKSYLWKCLVETAIIGPLEFFTTVCQVVYSITSTSQ